MRSEEEIKADLDALAAEVRGRKKVLVQELESAKLGFDIGDTVVREVYGFGENLRVEEEFHITGFISDGINYGFFGDHYKKGCLLEEPGTWRKKNG